MCHHEPRANDAINATMSNKDKAWASLRSTFWVTQLLNYHTYFTIHIFHHRCFVVRTLDTMQLLNRLCYLLC